MLVDPRCTDMKLSRQFAVLLLITGCVIAFPANFFAQTDNWTSVKALKDGTELIVTRKNSGRVVGYVQAVNDESVALTSDAGTFVIGKDYVSKIYYAVPRNKRKSLNRGALYGMIAGLVVGVAIGSVHEPEGQETPGLGAFLAGSAIGVWAGSRHAKGKDKGALIYSAR